MGFDEAVSALAGRLGAVLAAERERWVLWLPVAVGAGIGLYFALPEEPARWIGPLVLVAGIAAAVILRRRQIWFVIAFGVSAAALGFTVAVEHTYAVAAPVLARPEIAAEIEGRIVAIEPQEHGERLTLDHLAMSLRQGGPRPERVRVRLPESASGTVEPGERIALRATLLPPPAPDAPGAYDFAREAWFRRIGAVGYALGPPREVEAPPPAGLGDAIGTAVARARHWLTQRIAASISDPSASAVASDLVTGERGAVPPAVLQHYRDAGLAHILVIAGMHMSMVAGLVFFAVRGLLAAIPWIALRYPIKKWTAAIALLVMAGYLIISGASVPTQRAFVMNAIVMLAVLFDREAISLRALTWAALAVLLLEPQALVGPSFQMSFAAVYALIAAYEIAAPRFAEWNREDRIGWWTRPALYLGGIVLTTLVAGGATAFYTVYHFDRYATFAILGNILAVPVVGFWVMPAALLAILLLPFGLDGWGWWLMGQGIVAVDSIAGAVADLPGAAIDLPAMPVEASVAFTLGALWLVLWRRRWRRYGLIGMAAGLAIYAAHRPPDLLVDPAGRTVAIRTAGGSLAFEPARGARRMREAWAQLAGQGTRAPVWEKRDGMRCDAEGCLWRAKGHVVAIERLPEASREDCRVADLVIVPVPMFASCPSAQTVLDGIALRKGGTTELWLDGRDRPRWLTVADWQGARPWTSRYAPRRRAPAPRDTAPADSFPSVEDDAASSAAEAPRDDPEP